MADALPAAAPIVVGRYALYGKIASGGMATVYFGRLVGAAGFTRTVAIKRLHPHLAEEPDFVAMMIDEARVVARVQHPNVAQTLDVVAEGNELLIVMDYVAGESVARLLRAESSRQRHVPPNIVSSVMSGVLNGLHAAHEAKSDHGVPLGIVHRDVSPHNVIVGVDGLTRVIDFGVAKAAGRLLTTRAGVVKGKVPYMAPEQFAGQETSRQADIYAAGVVLWEMLTGRRLFKAEDESQLIAMVLGGKVGPPSEFVPGLPPELDAVAMRALARDTAVRYATAREMADALAHAVPPALPTETGAWVADAAAQVLEERSAQLADIESRSSIRPGGERPPEVSTVARLSPSGRPSPTSGGPPPPADDDLPTIASQPSSMSIETPSRGLPVARRTRRPAAWIAVGAVALVVATVSATLAWRPRSPSTNGATTAPTSTPTVRAAVAPSAPSGPVGSIAPDVATAPPSASVPPLPSVSVRRPGSAPVAPSSRPPPAAAATRARPSAPTPSGSVVFSTPD